MVWDEPSKVLIARQIYVHGLSWFLSLIPLLKLENMLSFCKKKSWKTINSLSANQVIKGISVNEVPIQKTSTPIIF